MHISWLGQTCVKLQTKNLEQDGLIIIDAYKPKTGSFPRSFTPEVALFSQGQDEEAATLSQNPFIIKTAGEFDIKNIVIHSLPVGPDNFIFKIMAEGISIVHLGRLNRALENGELEAIMNPDILFIPVGGAPTYMDAKTAAALANSLEPRVIIPIGHKCDTDPASKSISVFISEIGLKPEKEENKIIIKKKDLPQDETKLIVLEKE